MTKVRPGCDFMNKKICQSILYNSPIGYALHKVAVDESGAVYDYEILDINPAFERMLGFQAEEIVGKGVTQILPDIRRGTIDWVAFYGELALTGGNREFTYYWDKTKKWFRIRAYSPEKYFFVIFLNDISHEIQQIRELDTLFKVSPDLLCVLGEDGRLIRVNKAFEQFIGMQAEELAAKEFLSFVFPGDQEYTQSQLQNLLVQDSPISFVNRFHCHDNTYRYMEWQGLSYGAQLYLAARDITHSRIERAYFEALFLNTTDAMLYFDRETKIFNLNKQFTELFGYTLEELKGVCLEKIFPHEDQDELPLCRRILQGETIARETVRRSKSGKLIPVSVKGGPVYIDGELRGGFAVYTDISERKAYEEHLKHLSLHDQLTGLYNRNFFETQVKIIEKSKKYPISIIVFDVDCLKLINDTLGHAQGDKLLQLAADTISKSLRSTDFLARMGGDEFVAILPETDEETAHKIAGRIRDNLRKVNEEPRDFPISISIGAATAFNHGTSLKEVLRRADERMYHEKLVEKKGTREEIKAFLLKTAKKLNEAE